MTIVPNNEPPTDAYGLGRIREVSARDAVQGSENVRFTPWLATYVDVLADVLGFGLRVLGDGEDTPLAGQHVEVSVGSYFLDIRATDDTGRIVAIENQYGAADHKHLGQLIVYAAGVGADVLVWVAESFSDPHLEAIRWLNARTDSGCGVFAVRARFVQIGTSPAAPVFEVMARPSEWARHAREVGGGARERWTIESFVDACVAEDRSVLEALLAKVQAAAGARFTFGVRPNSYISVHPNGGRYAPFLLWLNSKGRVTVTGTWNYYADLVGHEGFGPLAQLLGQDHTARRATGVLLSGLDLDALWMAVLEAADAINSGGA